MSRRIGRTLPLLVGVLVCLAGCTFPKSLGLARKQEPQPQTRVAEDHPTTTQNAAMATEPKPSLTQAFRKTTSWLSFARHKPASTSDQPLVDNNDPNQDDPHATASQPLAYPNVVPPKYRNMGTGVSRTSLATDTSGTPSLVRPSRRPPPDPAPKPPQEEQEEFAVKKPRAEGPLYDIIAAASQSWRVAPRNAAVAASANASPRQRAAESSLKFTSPDRLARERKAVTKPTDIVTNMLRPAKSPPRAADKPAPTNVARAEAIRRAESNAPLVPGTNWIAKKTSPSSAAAGVSPRTVPAGQKQTLAIAVESGDPAASNVVANTLGGVASKSNAGSPSSPAATHKAVTEIKPRADGVTNTMVKPATKPLSNSTDPQVAEQKPASGQFMDPRSEPSRPDPKPVGPLVTIPNRSEAVARAEIARREMPLPKQRAYLAKSPSNVRPSMPTQAIAAAAAPTEAAEQETLAPLVDADTYRAMLANTVGTQPAPARTAARGSTQPVPGSWLAAYQRLVQRTGSRQSPRPPSGSPTRKLSSDDESEMLEPAAPILRR
jgi:hypothetical protein